MAKGGNAYAQRPSQLMDSASTANAPGSGNGDTKIGRRALLAREKRSTMGLPHRWHTASATDWTNVHSVGINFLPRDRESARMLSLPAR